MNQPTLNQDKQLEQPVTSTSHKAANLEAPQTVQTSEQMLGLINSDGLRQLLATALDQPIPGDIRPPWAIKATKLFWSGVLDLPRKTAAKSENYRNGYLFALIDRMPTNIFRGEQRLGEFFASLNIVETTHRNVRQEPPEQAAEFYAGFAEGLRRGVVLSAGRWAIYAVLGFSWQEVQKRKNVTDLHAWLTTEIGSNIVGDRETIAKICQKIGLKFADKGGRPKNPGKHP